MINLLICSTFAHTILFALNTPTQKNVNCIRNTASPPGQKNSPIKDLNSPDMTCGKAPTQAAPQQCSVRAGESVGLVWGHNSIQDDVIDPSHKGPCNVYLVPSQKGQNPPRAGWFKIYQGVWDAQNKWCVDKLIADKGILNVPIPANIRSGGYLLRAEINALHEAEVSVSNNPGRGSQFYVYCAELNISGGGSAMPQGNELVSIPGYLNANSPGVVFNLFSQGSASDSGSRYPTLGPQVARLAGGTSRSPNNQRPQQRQTPNQNRPSRQKVKL